MTTGGEKQYFSRFLPDNKPADWDEIRLSAICSFRNGSSLPSDERNDGDVPVYGSNGVVGTHDTAATDAPIIVIGRKGSAGKLNYSKEPSYVIDTAYYIDSESANCNLKWLYYLLKSLNLSEQSAHSAVPGINRTFVSEHKILRPNRDVQRRIANFLDTHTTRINQLIEVMENLIELLEEKREAAITQAVMSGLDSDVRMKDSGVEWVGSIPEHWEQVRIGSLIKQVKRPVDVSDDETYQEIGIRSHGKGIFHKEPVTGKEIGDKNVFEVIENALIFNIVFAWEGAVAVSTESERGMIASHRFPMFVARNDEVCLRYLKFFFTHGYGQGILDWNSPGSAGRNRTLNREAVLSERFWMPPPKEQKQITQYISSISTRIDSLSSSTKQGIELLEEKRDSLITKAVTGQIDLSDWQPDDKQEASP